VYVKPALLGETQKPGRHVGAEYVLVSLVFTIPVSFDRGQHLPAGLRKGFGKVPAASKNFEKAGSGRGEKPGGAGLCCRRWASEGCLGSTGLGAPRWTTFGTAALVLSPLTLT
jgi:hypothetical protein